MAIQILAITPSKDISQVCLIFNAIWSIFTKGLWLLDFQFINPLLDYHIQNGRFFDITADKKNVLIERFAEYE